MVLKSKFLFVIRNRSPRPSGTFRSRNHYTPPLGRLPAPLPLHAALRARGRRRRHRRRRRAAARLLRHDCVRQSAVASLPNHHVARFDRDPLVARRVEPSQSQIVSAVQISVLTVRKPPAALVIPGAVGVRDVAVDVDGGELHAVLVVEGVGRVAAVAGDAEAVAVRARPDEELAVHGLPGVVVDVLHDDLEAGAVVGRQVAEQRVADPVLARRSAEAVAVVVPGAVEVDAAVDAPLDRRPLVYAVRQDGVLLAARRNHEQAGRVLFDLRAVRRQLINNRLVLPLHRLQLLHQLRGDLNLGGDVRRRIQLRVGLDLRTKAKRQKR